MEIYREILRKSTDAQQPGTYHPRSISAFVGDSAASVPPTPTTAEPTRTNSTGHAADGGATSTTSAEPTGPLGITFSNLPNLPQLANGANVATDLLDAADKHVPTLSLNARRKFFHALAVVMFLPGVAVDVSNRLPLRCLEG